MNKDYHDGNSDPVWDQDRDYDDWPPPDEFRGVKLAIAGVIVVAALAAGGWLLWREMVPVDYRVRAMEYLAEGDYRSAVIDLKNVIQEQPNDAEMRWLLGNAYLQMGEAAYARDHLKTAFELGYYEQPLLLALTRANLLDGKDEEALRLIREWSDVETAAASAKWEVLRGRALLNLGKQERAAGAFVRALKLDAGNMEAKQGLAYTGVGANLSNLVGDAIDTALATGLDQPETWLLKGELELSRSAYEKSQTAFERAVELDPNNVFALSGLVRVLLISDQLEAAREPVRILTQRFPRDAGGAYVRALYARQRGDYDLALDALGIVLNQDSNHALSLLLLGEVQLAMGNHEQALLNLSRFHRLAPKSVLGRKRLASALIDNGQPERAVELLEPLVDQVHKDPEIATTLATAFARLGNTRKAKAYQSLSGKLDAGGTGNRIALEHLGSDQTQEAIAELELALSRDPDQLESRVLLALSHLRLGQIDAALAVTRTLLVDKPTDPQVQYLHGTVIELQGDVDAATQYYERALELDADFFAADLALARIGVAAGRRGEAKKRIQAVLDRDPGNATALVWLAQMAQQEDDTRQAVNLLEEARTHDESALQPRLILADIYLQQRSLDNALAVSREIVALAPRHPIGNYLLANALILAGDARAGVTLMEQLESTHPANLRLKWKMVDAYERLGDRQAVSDTLNRILQANEQNRRALVKLAMLERSQGKSKSALALADRLKQYHPDSGMGYLIHGQLVMDEGNYRPAADLLERAFELDRDSVTLSIWYAALRHSGQRERAEEVMFDWLTENPNDSVARLAVADMAEREKDIARAIDEYEWVTAREPNNVPVLVRLAQAYREVGDRRDLRTAQKAYELDASNIFVMDTYAWLLVDTGLSERGAEILQEVVRRAPKNGSFRYHLAVALSDSGANGEAQLILRELLQSGIKFAEQAEALALLERIKS